MKTKEELKREYKELQPFGERGYNSDAKIRQA
jgi:hypothetical protein